ncbi:hypothetical protein ASG60_19460 [Methylobacterium sp. Leaf469]|uniref:hypothetical protein n=1 Tax=unclassified Methylobacterium TaxID=2615210 RepID=UPI0006F34681|nr:MULTISPECIES: hypothetical protein [unclassified Methylobacterium]USU32684.1 hypothetical protein NG677_02960 [Methylobacterium sp. OTU13CASTA1]KQO70783.1 hypothetical protein ASF22_16055 [Methylobacterium sp. Leaf87]KQP21872.1 hypothetical protein ASF27_14990 [Methylobacterium sp. Leaf102]KQP32682.1 hypothetical protein ASF25_17935 [Methylobacterium sp. Leaf100]KQU00811.1 hypothetical protein ASG60_19460 [Methylobacterium sp. Leaf469]
MRHITLPRRTPTRRALAKHRPRPRTWSRVDRHRSALRISDVVLVLLGLALLGALCLGAAVTLLGRALAP